MIMPTLMQYVCKLQVTFPNPYCDLKTWLKQLTFSETVKTWEDDNNDCDINMSELRYSTHAESLDNGNKYFSSIGRPEKNPT